jgi:Ca2+-binding RTX toxin-like protein
VSYQPWGSVLNVTTAAGAADAVVAGIGLTRFVVAWEDTAGTGGDASGSAIRLKVYDPFGVAFTAAPILVNTATSGNQANPQVLGLAGGEFVVVWEDASGTGGDASGTAIKGQRFTANGEKLGIEFLVNTTTAGNQAGAALAQDGTGLVVAWVDASGANSDVRFQRFDANGVRIGGETTAGASTAGNQAKVEATAIGNGFALAWTDDADANATVDAIRVQAYTSGSATGAERSIVTGGQFLDTLVDMARIESTGGFAVLYTDKWPAQVTPRYLLETFDHQAHPVSGGPYDAGWTMSGYFVQGEALAGWQGVTLEPGALVRGDNDGMFNRGGLYVADVTHRGIQEGTTVLSTTSGGAPTVLDADMLWDGRVVTVIRQGDAINFAIADGRGKDVNVASAMSPSAVLVGADTGPYGNNAISGGNGSDRLYGLGGNDYLYGNFGADLMHGGAGSDVLIGGDGHDTLHGEAGDDYMYGNGGVNVFVGGDGVDVLISQGSSDTLYGGDGGDYLYAYAAGVVTQALGEGGNDIFVMQSGPGRAYGGDGQDYFYMGAGADLMDGGAGVDVLQGGGGTDTYDGGAGTDYLFLNAGSDTVMVNLQSGVDVVNDFSIAQDFLRLQGTNFTSFTQVQAAMTDYGSFSVLTIDANTAVWLVGITPGQLTASNVLFA